MPLFWPVNPEFLNRVIEAKPGVEQFSQNQLWGLQSTSSLERLKQFVITASPVLDETVATLRL